MDSLGNTPRSMSDTAPFDPISMKKPKYATLSLGSQTSWGPPAAVRRPFSVQVAQLITAEFWQILWQESREDVCNVSWKKFWKRSWHCFVNLCITLAALIPIVGIVLYVLLSSSVTGEDFDVCLPNGDFDISDNGYNPMSSENLFQITLGVGQMAFSNAKIIDVCFDIVSCPLLQTEASAD